MAWLSRAFFRTTVARLALIYIGVFALTTIALFSSVYVLTLRAVDDGTENLMESQLQGLSEQYASLGLRGLATAIRARSQSLDRSRAVYLLVDENLMPLAGNLNAWPQLNVQRDKWFEFDVTVKTEAGVEQHPIRAAVVTLPSGYRLLIGNDVVERTRLATVMKRVGALAVVLLVLIGAVIAVWMNRRLLNQVHAIAAAGQDIANGDFARRLPVRGSGDELDELAGNLNALLERIEQLTLALRFVIDGTAHDLRGPLNRMRMRLEQALEQAGSGRESIEAAMQDADALLRTLEALLRIAQAQSGAANAEIAELNLGKLVTEIAELYAPLAEERGITLAMERMEESRVQGSRQLLAHAVANLLDNAVKYTPAGGRITVSVTGESEGVVLRVTDNGPGIPAADRERVLQRFVRLDSTQAEPGTGLGLSLVAAVCRFHHASLSLEDAGPGLSVCLRFRAVA
ncbi:MAG: HAMP domain-containing sensor histidine kinase [Steroidobacteraceae bacterium]